MPWWNRPLRILQFNIEDAYGFFSDKITADTLVALAKKIHANTLIVFARDAWGRVFYNGSTLYPRHPTSKLDVKELVEKAHKNNIRVIVMAAHTANRYLYRLHPDWAQRNSKGEVVVLEHYPRAKKVIDPHWPQICPNSPALDLYFVPEVEEAVRLTGADGLLLDSFRYLPDPPRACFCEHCRSKFKREHGLELPTEMNIEDVAFREAWEWRYNVNVRAISKMREAVKKANPEALYFYNSHPIGWAGRGNIVVVKSRKYLDAVFAEASEVDVRGPGMLTIAAKLTRAMLGDNKPVFVSRNAFYDLRPPQSPPPPTIRLGIYEIAAAGGQPQVTMFSSEFFSDPRPLPAIEEAFSTLERIEEYLHNITPINYINIIFDHETHEKYYWNKPEYYVGEVEGFSLIAMHRHLPWRFISSVNLSDPENLSNIPVLVAAGMAVVDDDTVEILRQYVENGGFLVVTHEFGVMRPDFTYREALALQDIMGIKYEGVLWFGYSYLHLGREEDPIYREYWEGLPEAIPFGDHSTAFLRERVEPKLGEVPRIIPDEEKTLVLARTRLGRSAYGYEYTLGRSAPAPDSILHLAAITYTRYGKGSIAYYAHLVGTHYTRLGLPEYAELFTRVLAKHGPEPPVKADAPETVQVEPYKQGDRIIVQLVNHTYNQKFLSISTGPSKQALPSFEPSYRVHPIRKVIPVGPVALFIRRDLVGDGAVMAFEAVSGEEFEVSIENDYYRVVLPRLREYAVIVLESKK